MIYANKIKLTVNWVSESNTTKSDHHDFKELCKSSVVGLRKGEVVYCFTQEQVDFIKRKAPFTVIAERNECGFALRRIFS